MTPTRWQRLRDRWDALTAAATLRCHPLAQAYAYRGLRRDRHYSRRAAYAVARGLNRP